MDKSLDHEEIKQKHFVRSNVIAERSLVGVFLKAVPGSVQHNTAVHYVTKVPIISGKELKSMKNNLQFRSRTPFRWLTVKSHPHAVCNCLLFVLDKSKSIPIRIAVLSISTDGHRKPSATLL